MGIKGLSAFLKKHAPTAFAGHPVPKRYPEERKIAVDVSLFLHKFFYAVGPNHISSSFLELRKNMLLANMKPLWVFDGKPLDLKSEERQKRTDLKQAFLQKRMESENYFVVREVPSFQQENVTYELKSELNNVQQEKNTQALNEDQRIDLQSEKPKTSHYMEVRDLLYEDTLFTAKHEAEALCSYLVHQGQAYAALTNDSDAFAYICPRTILGTSMTFTNAKIVHMEEILRDLKVSEFQFQKFCVLCGNDFVENIRGVGPVAAWKHTLEGTFPECDQNTKERITKVQDLFKTCCYEMQ